MQARDTAQRKACAPATSINACVKL